MELIQLVSDLVKTQASQSTLTPDEMTDAIRKVYKALKWVQDQENRSSQAAEEHKMSGPDSIQRNKVICLECGKEFKVLTKRHLALHELDQREYKTRYGIPLRQALSARSLSARRRKVAKEKGLGERLQAGLKKARVAKEKELAKKLAKAKTTGKGKKRQRKAPAAAPEE